MNTESRLSFRRAGSADVPAVAVLLADDALGAQRERPDDLQAYLRAFDAIDRDPNNELIVALHGERLAGVMQLTFIPYLTHAGSWRALIEGVRIASDLRGEGLGRAMILHAIERARARGCRIVQLTTDKRRPEALRFYESLGFAATHEGLKLPLE